MAPLNEIDAVATGEKFCNMGNEIAELLSTIRSSHKERRLETESPKRRR